MITDKKRKRPEGFFSTTISFNYSIPPLNNRELKWFITDIIIKEIFKPPFDSLSILRYIKKGFRNVDFSSYIISKLKINEVIREYIKNQLITYEEIIIASRRSYYIKSIDFDKLKVYYNQISDSKITNDFDKYLEKAKSISYDCLKETNINYDEDDIIAKNHFDTERDNYFQDQNMSNLIIMSYIAIWLSLLFYQKKILL